MLSEIEKEIIVAIFTDEERKKGNPEATYKFDLIMRYENELRPLLKERDELKEELKLYRGALGHLLADKTELKNKLAIAHKEIKRLKKEADKSGSWVPAEDVWKINDYSRIREENRRLVQKARSHAGKE